MTENIWFDYRLELGNFPLRLNASKEYFLLLQKTLLVHFSDITTLPSKSTDHLFVCAHLNLFNSSFCRTFIYYLSAKVGASVHSFEYDSGMGSSSRTDASLCLLKLA